MNTPLKNQDTLIVQRGECLRASIDYTNEDGTELNLEDFLITCPNASHAALQEGVELTYVDASKGTANIYVPSTVMDTLPAGRSSWLRLAVTPDEEGACSSISMKLWVDIQ